MFLDKVKSRNKRLIDIAVKMHQKGEIMPDSYIIDIDTLLSNAKKMLEVAKQNNVRLLFMLKQLGRNPYIAKKLVDLGYEGAVVVDYNEAKIMMRNNIPIGNIGNLVQIPQKMIGEIIDYGVDVITVFSIEKLTLINEIAKTKNKVQKIIIKVYSDDDIFYSGQESGIYIDDLQQFLSETDKLSNIKIVGVTSFPAFLYEKKSKSIEKQNNYFTIMKAKNILEKSGIEVNHVNLPSATCIKNIKENFDMENLVGEPGHGLSGTTPAHVYEDLDEIPCVVYLTEISHNFKKNAFAYGGGYYRRSNVYNALVGNYECLSQDKIIKMDNDSIDYYFQLDNNHNVGDSVVMAFRFQIFVTRSKVVLIENIENNYKIVGVYDSLGRKYDE
ncbi:alanine racemase [Helcococcus ovis]|uniref:YhfX family PLP-dependent enzyme n=1 Tax=Helcococcus ovis TaxID=72026 RepID=A0A4R9C399_9FIRM|nr:alanine racemase [Helcococcus ovis]TFF66202.1 YhfX family PLP-dependent enzyme [Helcococcus ovis]TFF67319.1 YhfX family PLP-dependent enzyme [Helcococcus ovis]